MLIKSIRTSLNLLTAFLLVLLGLAIFSFFSERLTSRSENRYRMTVEMQKKFSDIILYEKLSLKDPGLYEALKHKYANFGATCTNCHKTTSRDFIIERQNIFDKLLTTHEASSQLYETLNKKLAVLRGDILSLQEDHAALIRRSAVLHKDNEAHTGGSKIPNESKIVVHIGRLQSDLNDIIRSFMELRLAGKPKNQYLEPQFSSLLEEFYLSVEDFNKVGTLKKDKILAKKLFKNKSYLKDTFARQISHAYKEDFLDKQLNNNRRDLLQQLGDTRVKIQTDNERTKKINSFLQYLALASTFLLIFYIILAGRRVINKTLRIVAETQSIKNDLSHRIEIGDDAFDEFRVVYEALNSMSDTINAQVQELQKAHDDLEIRVEERTADLRKANEQLQQEIKDRKSAETQIELQKVELAKRNFELSAIFEVSSKITRTINMPELFSEILNAVLGLEMFDTVRKGGIYLVEVNRMKLVTSLGEPEMTARLDSYEPVEECFCGDAVTRGEIIVSKHCFDEQGNFTVTLDNELLNNKVALPLRFKGDVVAILYFSIPAGSADSYIDKIHILTVIGNQIGIAIENARLYEETKYLSLYDPLTRVANRRLMDITLDKLFSGAKRYKQNLSVIMVDIDRFKDFNDAHGHHAGDKLLAEVVAIILGQIRSADIAARYGGEEFLIILPETKMKPAATLAERIRRKVEENSAVTISLGVAEYREDMDKKENLVGKADEALYRAKNGGRNRVESMETDS